MRRRVGGTDRAPGRRRARAGGGMRDAVPLAGALGGAPWRPPLRCPAPGGARPAADTARPRVSRSRPIRSGGCTWVLTAGHFVAPPVPETIHVRTTGPPIDSAPRVVRADGDPDLALLLVPDLVLPSGASREIAHLGDDVWVVAFPRGRQMTLASGTVSQVGHRRGDDPDRGPGAARRHVGELRRERRRGLRRRDGRADRRGRRISDGADRDARRARPGAWRSRCPGETLVISAEASGASWPASELDAPSCPR